MRYPYDVGMNYGNDSTMGTNMMYQNAGVGIPCTSSGKEKMQGSMAYPNLQGSIGYNNYANLNGEEMKGRNDVMQYKNNTMPVLTGLYNQQIPTPTPVELLNDIGAKSPGSLDLQEKDQSLKGVDLILQRFEEFSLKFSKLENEVADQKRQIKDGKTPAVKKRRVSDADLPRRVETVEDEQTKMMGMIVELKETIEILKKK